jgi:hypothetical protein
MAPMRALTTLPMGRIPSASAMMAMAHSTGHGWGSSLYRAIGVSSKDYHPRLKLRLANSLGKLALRSRQTRRATAYPDGTAIDRPMGRPNQTAGGHFRQAGARSRRLYEPA